MSDIMDQFWRQPPLARTFALSIFLTSLGVYSGVLPAHWLYFHTSRLFRIPPEIWRPVTSYFVSSPKLGILLDPYYIFSYVSQLETGNPKFTRKEDVLWYLAFVGTMIITADTLIGSYSGYYLQGLVLALAYTGSQDQRGVKTNFFFVTIPAQLVPYAMILISFIMNGPGMLMLQLCGLFAAHLHDFLTRLWPEFGGGRNWIQTPAFLSRFSGATERVTQRAYGTAIRSTGSTTGAQAGNGVLPDSWRTRGKGQRLGGD